MQMIKNGETKQESRTCEKHGEYITTLSFSSALNRWVECGCPACVKEREADELAKEEKDREKEERDREERIANDAEKFFTLRGIPMRYRDKKLNDIIAETQSQKDIKSMMVEYVKNQEEFAKTGRSYIFYGQPGTGKTHIAISIIKAWKGIGYYISAREYTRLLRDTYSKSSDQNETDIIKRFVGYDILAIDEIGKQFATENERYAIFDIINQRYNDLKPTILISNMNLADIEDFLGAETVDRLKENGGQAILFEGKSFRKIAT